MFLVANVECVIPVCLCIGEVVPAQGHRYLATSPAPVSRPNTQSGTSRIFLCLSKLRFFIQYSTVRLYLPCYVRVLPRFRDSEVW